jgi:hypothetical protein
MVNSRKQRLNRVDQVINRMPVRTELLDKAFQEFCETGELPEEKRLAWAVCKQALNGGRPLPDVTDQAYLAMRLREAVEAINRGESAVNKPKEMSVRERLFDEAVYAPEELRVYARGVLKIRIGFLEEDPTDPNWLVNQPLPDFPGIGLFMLGFPRRLAKPPYEEQAERLFARASELRNNRIDHDDPAWQPAVDSAIRDVEDFGKIPEPGLLRDTVLMILELSALRMHSRGESVCEVMALLDTAALTTGEEREVAIARIGESALVGFIDPPTNPASAEPTTAGRPRSPGDSQATQPESNS